MRKRLCVALALLLPLAACGDRPTPAPPIATMTPTARVDSGPSMPPDEGDEPLSENSSKEKLYFLSGDGLSLVPSIEDVDRLEGSSQAESVLDLYVHLEPPDALGRPFSKTVGFISLEMSNDVAIVNLSRDWTLNFTSEDLYYSRLAIAKTLTEQPNIKYVQVLRMGREPGVGNDKGGASVMPIGLLSPKADVNLPESWALLEGEYDRTYATTDNPDEPVSELPTMQRVAAIYYPSKYGDHVLSKAVPVQVGINAIKPIVDEFLKSPEDVLLQTTLPSDVANDARTSPQFIPDEDENIIDLALSGSIEIYWQRQMIDERVAIGAMVLSLCTFVPQADGVRLTINGEGIKHLGTQVLENGILRRDMFTDLIGQTIKLYYPRKSDHKQEVVSRTIDQKDALQPEKWLQELLRATSLEAKLHNPFPGGLDDTDIRSVAVANGKATVDLSQRFQDLCQGMTYEQEIDAIYCMLNTIVGFGGIQRVQFTVEGRVVETLAGNVYIEEPLIRHTGIIAEP